MLETYRKRFEMYPHLRNWLFLYLRDFVLSGHTIPFGIVLVISPVYILHLSTSPRKVVEALVEFYGIELKLGLTQRKNILKYKKNQENILHSLSLF